MMNEINVMVDCDADGRYLPNFEKVAQNVTVTKGQNALLTCHVTHLGGYKVGWIKLDSKAIQAIHTHVITHNSRVSVQHFAPSMWQLNISNVQAEDQGPYMCQLNTDPMRNQVPSQHHSTVTNWFKSCSKLIDRFIGPTLSARSCNQCISQRIHLGIFTVLLHLDIPQ